MSILTIATRTASVVRPPKAEPVRGRLFRRGLDEPVGHPFLDRAGADDVVVTECREPFLRGPHPSVHGLTIRVPLGEGLGEDAASPLELVLAASSWSRASRRVRHGSRGVAWPMTGVVAGVTRGDEPLLVAARMVGGSTAELAVAWPGRPWQELGCLIISTRVAA